MGRALPSATMANDTVLEGFDVSKWQGTVKWPELRTAGKAFAFARVSDGLKVVDAFFEANWRGMKEAGLIRGAYQFFRASQDPIEQAELLLSRVGTLGPGDLPPALDLELTDGRDAATVVAAALAWLRHVEKRLGRKPLLYTGNGIWKELLEPKGFSDYALWVAHYGVSQPRLPEGWGRWTFWQYSQSGQLPGIAGAVDLNRFNGSLEELHALAGMSSTVDAPAAVTATPAAEPPPAEPTAASETPAAASSLTGNPPRPTAQPSSGDPSMLQVLVNAPSPATATPPGALPSSTEGLASAASASTSTSGKAPASPAPSTPSPTVTASTPPAPAPQTATASPPLDASVDTRVRQRLASPMPEELQQELAQLLNLREDAASLLGPSAAEQVELGIVALLGETPNLPFAQAIHKSISSRLDDRTRPLKLTALLRTDSPSMQVMLGLGAQLLCTALLGGLAHWKLMSVDWTLFQLPPSLLLLTVLGGMVGSVASILVRIRDFDSVQGATPASLVLLGFSKPVVGACFALFVLSVLKAQLLPIQVPAPGPMESYFFLALSFVCGFSERLAQDLVTRLEDGLLKDGAQQTGQEAAVSRPVA